MQSRIRVGNLQARRDFTDAARHRARLLDRSGEGRAGEVYNLCNGKSITIQRLLEKLLALSNVKAAIVQDPARMRPSDVEILEGSNDKFKAATGGSRKSRSTRPWPTCSTTGAAASTRSALPPSPDAILDDLAELLAHAGAWRARFDTSAVLCYSGYGAYGGCRAEQRVEVLFDPGEYERLAAIARRRHQSIGQLLREAAAEKYFPPGPDRGSAIVVSLRARMT